MAHQPASSTLGADILLARHGKSIVAWRIDRSGETTRAKLKDGSWDSAPNSLVRLGEPPAAKAATAVGRWQRQHGERAGNETRFLGKVVAAWAVGSAVIMVGLMALLGQGADPQLLDQLVTAPGA